MTDTTVFPLRGPTGPAGSDAPAGDLTRWRTSPLATLPRQLVVSSFTVSNGTVYGSRAYAYEAFTVTRLRTYLASNAWAGVTGALMGIWSIDGTLLGQTVDFAARVVGNATLNENLVTPVAVTAGTEYWLGLTIRATTFGQGRGINPPDVAQAPALTRGVTGGWTGGATLPNLNTTGSGNVPIIEARA